MIEEALAPITLEQFATEYYEKRALHLTGRGGRYAALPFDFRELLESVARPKPGAATMQKAIFFDKDGRYRMLRVDGAAASTLAEAGMTICFNVVDPYLPALQKLSARIRKLLHHDGLVNFGCYWSPEEGGGLPIHLDDHSNFIFQISGKKAWTYSATPGFAHPRAAYMPEDEDSRVLFASVHGGRLAELPQEQALSSCELTPGDLLYLPSGTWHRTRAGSESVALTLRLFPMPMVGLAGRALLPRLARSAPWRAGNSFVKTQELSEPERALFESRLAELRQVVNDLTGEELASIWLASL